MNRKLSENKSNSSTIWIRKMISCLKNCFFVNRFLLMKIGLPKKVIWYDFLLCWGVLRVSVVRRQNSKRFVTTLLVNEKLNQLDRVKQLKALCLQSRMVTFQSLTNCSRKPSKKTAAVKPGPGIQFRSIFLDWKICTQLHAWCVYLHTWVMRRFNLKFPLVSQIF